MRLLSAAEILAADDASFEDVPVPEWGQDAHVRVRSLSGEERDAYGKSITRVTGKGKNESREVILEAAREKLVARVLVDEKGERLFTDADVAKLAKKNAEVIERLFVVAQRLSGLAPDSIEELAGESAAVQTSSEPTG